MSSAIKFENISKQYRLGLVSTNTLSHDLNRWWQTSIRGKEDPYLKIGEVNDRAHKGTSDYVWALKDINFEVQQGDVLGIIGKNGAGKSTLLKILSKVTAPTTGIIKAHGRIASLLEVGTGFHPEMTGRENIYMNGAIMGMTKAEIARKFDEIVDFSGVERYIDTPAKRYSSGMTVRLGFAIAAHLEPEILVVDEVLAVGDAEFQKKAIGKMQDVSRGEGRTVLFVSHNMAAIENLCNGSLVIENGKIIFNGGVKESIEYYLESNISETAKIMKGMQIYNSFLEILQIKVNGSESNHIIIDQEKNSIKLEINGTLTHELQMELEMFMFDMRGTLLAVYSPGHKSGIVPVHKAGAINLCYEFELPKNMSKGEFYFDIELNHPNVQNLMVIRRNLFVTSNGYVADSGFEFNYSNRGLLIL